MDERFIDNGDITLRVEVTGDGPTLLFVHGWPELSHSWRHQVAHFAERGYTCAALDVRGYGGSSNPTEIERYTLRELAGDVAAVAAALSDEPVVLVGHDWGAPTVWPAGPLPFLSDDDLDVYVRAFERSGTTGAFNRYRALALEVDDAADIVGATVDRPSCFIGGEFDVVRTMIPGVESYADPGAGCTDFRGTTIVAGSGHWVQQEAPAAVNAALEAFLATL